jgi:hypothetical protein
LSADAKRLVTSLASDSGVAFFFRVRITTAGSSKEPSIKAVVISVFLQFSDHGLAYLRHPIAITDRHGGQMAMQRPQPKRVNLTELQSTDTISLLVSAGLAILWIVFVCWSLELLLSNMF